MRIYNESITNKFDTLYDGNSGANLPVCVRIPSNGVKATLYNKEGQEVNNPVMSDPNGNYSFYIEEGFYDIIENEGAPSQFTKFDEPILGGTGAYSEELIQLADGQTDVTFSRVNAFAALVYMQGDNVDRGLLSRGDDKDYIAVDNETIRLNSSRPLGSSIRALGSTEVPDGEVTSVFGRTGDVSSSFGDYDASEIENTPSGNITSTDQQSVNNELDSNISALNSSLTSLSNSVSTVNELSVGGVAVAGGQINQIVDSGSFTAPAASSVPSKTILVIELPDVHATETPDLASFAGDVFENSEGTDTNISWVGAARLTLTSNGVDRWRL